MSTPRRTFRDEHTGRRVWQVTEGPALHHHLYYLTPSWTPDGRWLIHVRYESDRANLVAVPGAGGAARTLTGIEDLHPFSGCPAQDGQGVHFTAGSQMRRVEIADGRQHLLAEFDGGTPGNCMLSADGRFIVTNVRRGPWNCVTVVGTDGTGAREVLRTQREVGHVQFDPTGARRILYSGSLTERLWMVGFDGSGDRLLRAQAEGELLLHEFWSPDGAAIYFVHWPFGLRRIDPDGTAEAGVVEMNAWHVAPRHDGRLLVCDTNHPDTGLHLIDPARGSVAPLCVSGATNLGTQWRHTFPREGAHMDVTMLGAAAAQETPWGPQWTHPHPSFSPSGDRVVFTSDRSGVSQVYVVEL